MGRAARGNLNVLGHLRLVLELEQRQVESELAWSRGKLSRLEYEAGPRSSGYREDIQAVLNRYELHATDHAVIYNFVLMLMGLAHELQASDETIQQAAASARKCDPNVPSGATSIIRPRSYRPASTDQQKIMRQVIKHLLRAHPIWRTLVA